MKRAIILLPFLLFGQSNLSAEDFYVDARRGSNTAGNGSKEKPWFTISFALSKITGTGHAIRVAPGTYDTVMDGVFPEIFPLLIRSGISIIGAGADSTVIDAKTSNTVMRFENTGSAQIKLEGCTIRNGKSSAGGGIVLQNSNILVQFNVFDRNEQVFGGSGGGAIAADGGTITITQNSFTANKAGSSGGAILVSNGTVSIRKNQLLGNSATFSGSAFYMRTNANVSVEIVDNVFRANGSGNEDIYIGSFLSQSSLAPLISRNVITSGIHCENSKPRILNNTLVGTSSKNALELQNAAPLIMNNIIANWKNGIIENNAASDPDTVAYNLFFNNTCLYYDENIRCLNTLVPLEALTAEAAHNLAGDPKFVDAAKNDYRLLPGSPAIDAGDPNSPKDPDNTRADIGALHFSPMPPAAPLNLQAAAGDRQVTLVWSANAEADFLRYRIYGGTSPNPAAKIDSIEGIANTTKTITNLANGTAYYFRLTAVNTSLQESGFSNQASATPALFAEVSAALTGVKRGAVAWGDYDNDNDLDMLLIGDSRNTDDPANFIAKIYRNDGSAFVDTNAPLARVTYGAVAWGDYDNDGDLDILLTGTTNGIATGAITKIYRNDNRNFVEVAAGLTGVFFSSVAWGDYDNDGDLDVVLTGRAGNDRPITKIYRNNAGVFNEDLQVKLISVSFSSVAWGDYDNDGDLDILLTGSTEESRQGLPSERLSKVYQNDGGIFTEITIPLGVWKGTAAWSDYDNDGDLDILLTGESNSDSLIARIYRNDNTVFVSTAIALTGVHKSSAKFGDYDNDGDLDILLTGNASQQTLAHTTKIYRHENGIFSDISAALPGVSESAVDWGDYDNDGDLDILLAGARNADPLAAVFRNNSSPANTVPAVPGGLAATVNGNSVTLNWNKSSDNQTAANALTYNLRAGKTPGGNEIVAPMANVSTGYRRVPLLGNTNHHNSLTLKNLPDGKYFWSVQAIDHAFAGSAFAAEQSFTIGTASNRAPVVANMISNQTLTAGGAVFTRNLNAAPAVFSDPDGDALTYTATTSAPNNASANISGSILTVAPVSGGVATITLTANDGKGGMISTGFTVTVNRPPNIANLIPNQALTVGGASFTRILTASPAVFNDPDGDPLGYTASSNASSIATASISASTLTVAPVAVGSATITVTANDNRGGTASTTFTVTVAAAPNRAPELANAISNQTLTVGGASFTRDLDAAPVVFNDPDGDPLTYTTNSNDANIATAGISGSTLTVTPVAAGSTRIVMMASDGRGGGTSTSFVVTVNPRSNLPPSLTHTATALAQEGLAIPISANITDDFGALNVQLNYRRGGAASYSAVTMNSTVDPTYQALIPANDVTARGVEYFILATDVDSAQARRPATGSFSIQIQVSHARKSEAQPSGSAATAYRLISVPLQLDNPSATAMLEDDLGPYNDAKWRLFGLAPVTSQDPNNKTPYVEFRTGGDLSPGKSLFLIVADPGKTITAGAAKSLQTDQEFQLTLQRGHNFIGTPFNFTIPTSKLRLQSGAAVTLWTYNGSFAPATELRPWEGYYVANLNQNSDVLSINPNLSPSMPARVASQTGWRLQILASCGQARDDYNFAGVAATSSDDYDGNDLAEPPPIGDFVSLYFPHPEWQKALARFSDDWRANTSENHQWRFHVVTNIANEPVTLRFEGLQEIDRALGLWLVDDELKYKQNLRENATYQYLPRRVELVNAFTLIVGKKEFVDEHTAAARGVPENFVLEQNFPNPFAVGASYSLQPAPETAFRFGLPQPSVVTIKIFDLAGHEVITLLDRVELSGGRHQRVWDGRDAQGRMVVSGIYFCQLLTGKVSRTVKLMLMR